MKIKRLISTVKNILNFDKNQITKDSNWWINCKCTSCQNSLNQEPYSYCERCKRTLCKKCGYIPGGCGWCGG